MTQRLLASFVLILVATPIRGGPPDGNRLTYLDRTDPYYVGRSFSKLVTPQWVGEPGVEAVVILAIDDMRGPEKWEAYLRPILERLKKIDGCAAVSIMTNQVEPSHPHLQTWLKEGVSLETHTFDHPCPLFKGDFDKAKATYDRAVDLLADVPNNRPVAFRTPCCDSLNTVSPRFFSTIFARPTQRGRFLSLDSSVFNVFTPDDPDLPRDLVTDADGRGRFAKYLPADRTFVNFVENYPYPYVVNKLCWEFPCVTPSDWQAQHLHKPNNPVTVRDWQAALDCTVIKRGVFCLVFHPHGWIKSDQVVDFIDYAVAKHGKKVKFLTFREAQERLDKNLLDGNSLRGANGHDFGVRLLDLDIDGYLDIVIGNEKVRRTRRWSPGTSSWIEGEFPCPIVIASGPRLKSAVADAGARFGVLQKDGRTSVVAVSEFVAGGWDYVDGKWTPNDYLHAGSDRSARIGFTSYTTIDRGYRFLDLDGNGRCELVIGNERESKVFQWDEPAKAWLRMRISLPAGAIIADAGRDRGLRFVDVDGDSCLDVIWSNDQSFGLYLFEGMAKGWTRKVLAGKRGDPGELPPFVVAGVDNGAWFHDRSLCVINEHTHLRKDFVDRRSFNDLLSEVEPTAKSPAASAALMKARPGFVVELMATEPLVQSPIALAFGADGKLWVVEMGDYPSGEDGKGKPGGRIKCLERTNGDGSYDKATVFLDNLAMPTGVLPWRAGVLITCAPDILYAQDTDGDGKADKVEKLFTGFTEGNPQHLVNGLSYGLDNWIYGANGDSGGKIRSTMTGRTVELRGRDFRFRPETGEFELQAGQTQFGRCRDDWGNWFGGNNISPGWHFALDEHYLRRNPHLAPPDSRSGLAESAELPPVFPRSRTLSRFNDFHTANRFTSACGFTIYRDDLFGTQFTGNLFVCEPVHNLVSRLVLTPEGSTFKGRRAIDERSSEFLASADNWFRPTTAVTGPDGALWIADMYRHVIEHPEWIPQTTQRTLDLRAGHDRGRIYRVNPAGVKPRPIPRLDKLDAAGLVAALDSPNGWQRDTAQRLLIERNDRTAVPKLEQMIRTGARPEAWLHALCTLDGLGALQPAIVKNGLKDTHVGVRRQAVRLSEQFLSAYDSVGAALLPLVADSDVQVKMQLAYTLGEWSDPTAGAALGKLLANATADRYLTAAALSSLNVRNFDAVLRSVLAPPTDAELKELFRRVGINVSGSNNHFHNSYRLPSPALVQELLRYADAFGNNRAIITLLETIAKPPSGEFGPWQFMALTGLLDSLDQRRSSLAAFARRNAETKQAVGQLGAVFSAARTVAADGATPPEIRVAAVRLLGRGPDSAADLDRLGALLTPQTPSEIQSAAVAAIGRLRDASVPERLLKNWHAYAPPLRVEVLELLSRRADWLTAALEAAERGHVPPGEIDATRRQQWLTHFNATIRSRATKLFGAATGDRQKVLDAYRDVIKLTGDSERGKQHFAKHCVSCHKLGAGGSDVGPDLGGLGDKPIDYLLTALLDPNRAVETRYIAYVADTKAGQRLTGLITSESGNRLTLVGTDGKPQHVLRQDLDSFWSTGKSLMPEGIETDLPPQAMADLLAHIKSNAIAAKPRTFVGNVPTVVRPGPGGALTLRASSATIGGSTLVFEARYGNLGHWSSADDRATWSVAGVTPGKYAVIFEWACDNSSAGNRFALQAGTESISGTVASSGSWDLYRTSTMGTIALTAETRTIEMRAVDPIRGALIDLKAIRMERVKE